MKSSESSLNYCRRLCKRPSIHKKLVQSVILLHKKFIRRPSALFIKKKLPPICLKNLTSFLSLNIRLKTNVIAIFKIILLELFRTL